MPVKDVKYMLTLNIIDFIESFPIDAIDTFLYSRIQKIVSAALSQGQPGEIFLFVLHFLFHVNNLQLVPNTLGTEHISKLVRKHLVYLF